MQKIRNNILLSSLVLMVLLLSLSSVSAEDISDNDISSLSDLGEGTVEDDFVLCSDSSSNDNLAAEEMESDEDSLKEPKIGANDLKGSTSLNDNVYSIDSDNFSSYFVDGVLKEGFNDSILVFNGEFIDKGIIDIRSHNVTVIGNNSLLKNTVFCLESSNVMLTGLNFVLDQEFADNDYAGILVLGDNCTVYNCTMNYSVPEATSGFCVYAEGGKIQNFTLANSTFNFIGNNLNGGWDYGIFIDDVDNSIVYGNIINCSLPLRAVNYGMDIFGSVSIDSVGAFVAQRCSNLTLSDNKISTYVSGGGNYYPTLDTVIIYDCKNVVIEGNRIYSEDFDSKNGKDNYLQGIDLYFSNNVTIVHNQVDIRTTGGCPAMGTAYPIQVMGPSKGVLIAYNNLTTVNFGPNCGIYSMNFYGFTQNYIISNFINVTGDATVGGSFSPTYCMVAGIEVQDSDDLIWNNTIIVTDLSNHSSTNNVFGISYSQDITGDHTYNIQYNNVSTNGRYAISLSGSKSYVVNSIVANNVLNTATSSGGFAVRVGKGRNNTICNNTDGRFTNTLNEDDLPDWLKNHKSIVPSIFVPKYYREGSHGSGLTPSKGNGTVPWNSNGSGVSGNGNNPNSDNVLGSDRDTTPGIGGDSSPSISAADAGSSGSSAADPNAYEINEHDNLAVKSVDYLQLGIICIVVLLLLLVGYKRQKDKEEEE